LEVIRKKVENKILRCVNCGYCVGLCPVRAITLTESGVVFSIKKCRYPFCQNCLTKCPVRALEVYEMKGGKEKK
jgi:pyruvate formate lyase activating enzyme